MRIQAWLWLFTGAVTISYPAVFGAIWLNLANHGDYGLSDARPGPDGQTIVELLPGVL